MTLTKHSYCAKCRSDDHNYENCHRNPRHVPVPINGLAGGQIEPEPVKSQRYRCPLCKTDEHNSDWHAREVSLVLEAVRPAPFTRPENCRCGKTSQLCYPCAEQQFERMLQQARRGELADPQDAEPEEIDEALLNQMREERIESETEETQRRRVDYVARAHSDPRWSSGQVFKKPPISPSRQQSAASKLQTYWRDDQIMGRGAPQPLNDEELEAHWLLQVAFWLMEQDEPDIY